MSFSEDPTQGAGTGRDEDPTAGPMGGESAQDDPTQASEAGAREEDPTQGASMDEEPGEDPTEAGEAPGEDPTAPPV
jgi:hypothetical protein